MVTQCTQFLYFTWEQLKAFLIYSHAVAWHLIFKTSVNDTVRGVRKLWEAQVTDAGLECYLQWSLSFFNAQQAEGLAFEGEEMKVSNCVLFELQWSSTTKQLSRSSHLSHLFPAYLFWRAVSPLKTQVTCKWGGGLSLSLGLGGRSGPPFLRLPFLFVPLWDSFRPLHPQHGCRSHGRPDGGNRCRAAGLPSPWLDHLQELVQAWSRLCHTRTLCDGGSCSLSRWGD